MYASFAVQFDPNTFSSPSPIHVHAFLWLKTQSQQSLRTSSYPAVELINKNYSKLNWKKKVNNNLNEILLAATDWLASATERDLLLYMKILFMLFVRNDDSANAHNHRGNPCDCVLLVDCVRYLSVYCICVHMRCACIDCRMESRAVWRIAYGTAGLMMFVRVVTCA